MTFSFVEVARLMLCIKLEVIILFIIKVSEFIQCTKCTIVNKVRNNTNGRCE